MLGEVKGLGLMRNVIEVRLYCLLEILMLWMQFLNVVPDETAANRIQDVSRNLRPIPGNLGKVTIVFSTHLAIYHLEEQSEIPATKIQRKMIRTNRGGAG
jgi:hypothetical protein